MLQPKAFRHSHAVRQSWRFPPSVTAAAVLLGIFDGCGSSGSPATQTSVAQETRAPDNPLSTAAICPKQGESGFESVEVAFRQFAEAINHRNWCEAAGTFGALARVDLAETNFKALTLLAGAANPKREQYQVELQQFCREHGLPCQDPRWVEQTVADIMTGTDVAPKLVELRRFAADNPAQIYRELMLHMSAVDASVLEIIDPTLDEVSITDGKATGKAKRENGRVSPIKFAKAETGWQLSVR